MPPPPPRAAREAQPNAEAVDAPMEDADGPPHDHQQQHQQRAPRQQARTDENTTPMQRGKIWMAYDDSVDRANRIQMPDYELVGLYHTHAIGLPNAPPLPEHGIHARPYGPWEIPMASYELAVEFAEANPQIEFENLPIRVKAFKLDEQQADTAYASGPAIASLLKEQGAWMELRDVRPLRQLRRRAAGPIILYYIILS